MPTVPPATLVISLDFELYWGVRDRRTLASYRENLEGVHEAVPALLALFEGRGIHATWATVGFVCLDSFDEVLDRAPTLRPGYRRRELCPYIYVEEQRTRSRGDKCHFAPELVRRIAATPHQEIGTHTLSHFCCLEDPGDVAAFEADLAAAIAVARDKLGLAVTSLVFPRNQLSPAHVATAERAGITAVRGNPASRLYAPRRDGDETLWRRGGRFLDAYVPVSRRLSRPLGRDGGVVDVPATRFLRPWSPRLRRLEALRVRRIQSEIRAAAGRGDVYHLWWHPHNFGVHLAENLAVLEAVLDTFEELRAAARMQSLHMGEAARAYHETSVHQ
jgi:peptidoglycan/xylan/chitin deacetylase (PgdA/CDA1 family)